MTTSISRLSSKIPKNVTNLSRISSEDPKVNKKIKREKKVDTFFFADLELNQRSRQPLLLNYTLNDGLAPDLGLVSCDQSSSYRRSRCQDFYFEFKDTNLVSYFVPAKTYVYLYGIPDCIVSLADELQAVEKNRLHSVGEKLLTSVNNHISAGHFNLSGASNNLFQWNLMTEYKLSISLDWRELTNDHHNFAANEFSVYYLKSSEYSNYTLPFPVTQSDISYDFYDYEFKSCNFNYGLVVALSILLGVPALFFIGYFTYKKICGNKNENRPLSETQQPQSQSSYVALE